MQHIFFFAKLQSAQKATVLLTAVCLALLAYRWRDITATPAANDTAEVMSQQSIATAPPTVENEGVSEMQQVEFSIPELPLWFLQAGVYGDEAAAMQMLTQLQQRGIAASICRDDGGYRVLCGVFLQKADAQAAAQSVGEETYIKMLIRPQLHFNLQADAAAGEIILAYVQTYAQIPQGWKSLQARLAAAQAMQEQADALAGVPLGADNRFLQDIAADMEQFALWMQDETLCDSQVICRILFTAVYTCMQHA